MGWGRNGRKGEEEEEEEEGEGEGGVLCIFHFRLMHEKEITPFCGHHFSSESLSLSW